MTRDYDVLQSTRHADAPVPTRASRRSPGDTRRSALVFALLGALATAGCDEGGDEGEDPELATGDAFLVGTRIWDDTTTTSYFHTLPSLAAGTVVDPARALEVSGAAKLYSIPGVGWFAIGSGEEPTITRYTLDELGNLVPGVPMSLALYGVESLWDSLYVVSATKMYYPDRDNSQLIAINPTTMEIEGAIDLGVTAREPYLSLYAYTPHLRDGRLMFSVGWFDWNEDRVLPETGLVVIDTQSNQLATFTTDARCGGITTSVATVAGDAYFVSSALAGVAHRLGRLSTAPCALRVLNGQETFDPTYLQALATLTGSATAGEPIPAGNDAMFLRVLDETLVPAIDAPATWDITGQAAWRWMRWDLGLGTLAPIDTLAPSTSDVLWFVVDGRVYGTETKPDYSESTLIELTAAGGPVHGVTVPGFLHGVGHIR